MAAFNNTSNKHTLIESSNEIDTTTMFSMVPLLTSIVGLKQYERLLQRLPLVSTMLLRYGLSERAKAFSSPAVQSKHLPHTNQFKKACLLLEQAPFLRYHQVPFFPRNHLQNVQPLHTPKLTTFSKLFLSFFLYRKQLCHQYQGTASPFLLSSKTKPPHYCHHKSAIALALQANGLEGLAQQREMPAEIVHQVSPLSQHTWREGRVRSSNPVLQPRIQPYFMLQPTHYQIPVPLKHFVAVPIFINRSNRPVPVHDYSLACQAHPVITQQIQSISRQAFHTQRVAPMPNSPTKLDGSRPEDGWASGSAFSSVSPLWNLAVFAPGQPGFGSGQGYLQSNHHDVESFNQADELDDFVFDQSFMDSEVY